MTCQHDDRQNYIVADALERGGCLCTGDCCNLADPDACICPRPEHDPVTCTSDKHLPGGPAAGPDRTPTAAPSPSGALDLNAYTYYSPDDVVIVRNVADGPIIGYGVRKGAQVS